MNLGRESQDRVKRQATPATGPNPKPSVGNERREEQSLEKQKEAEKWFIPKNSLRKLAHNFECFTSSVNHEVEFVPELDNAEPRHHRGPPAPKPCHQLAKAPLLLPRGPRNPRQVGDDVRDTVELLHGYSGAEMSSENFILFRVREFVVQYVH